MIESAKWVIFTNWCEYTSLFFSV